MDRKLYRNEHDKTVAGVASGLADYLQIDAVIVKVLFVLTTIFLAGSGAIAYIVLWIVAPVNNDPTVKFRKFNDFYNQNPSGGSVFNSPNSFNANSNAEQTKWNTPNTNNFSQFQDPMVPKGNDTGKTVVGLILLVLGVYFLLRELNIMPYWFNIFHIYKLWPLAIVAVGVSLIFKNKQKSEWEVFKNATEQQQKEESVDKPVDVTKPEDTSTKDDTTLPNA